MRPFQFLASFVFLCVCGVNHLSAQSEFAAQSPATAWTGSWASSQQQPESTVLLSPSSLTNATLREIVHLSAGGNAVRVHISNGFGSQPMLVEGVHVGVALHASSSAINSSTDRALTFAGSQTITIPPYANYTSDPLNYTVPAGANLAVSIYFTQPPFGQTAHEGSYAVSYLVPGNQLSKPDMTGEAAPANLNLQHWFFLSAVDVAVPVTNPSSVVVLGDSITDGHGTQVNSNTRWTDLLAGRLQANSATRYMGVLNQGIAGNHLLTWGLGPDALSRFDRDVVGQTAVQSVVIENGINDLGDFTRNGYQSSAAHQLMVKQIISAYQQLIERAHAARLQIVGATITPFSNNTYYHPPSATEADRQAINAWVRTPGNFDAVLDFDKTLADRAHPSQLLPAYDSGDHIHPSAAGYQRMASIVPLTLFPL